MCPEKNHQEYACLDPQIDVTQIFPNAMNILFLNNEYEYSHVLYIHDHWEVEWSLWNEEDWNFPTEWDNMFILQHFISVP